MDKDWMLKLLTGVSSGGISPAEALAQLAHFPVMDLGHTRLDTQRELRNGFGEVIFAESKATEALLQIVAATLNVSDRLLITRLHPPQIDALRSEFSDIEVCRRSRTAIVDRKGEVRKALGDVAVVTAGTSDAGVAREAAVCARYFGLSVTEICDVGVAGLQRLFEVLPELHKQDLLIVVAGMEAALPGVISGLCPAPVIGVPTSVGYGASQGGMTALCGMLVSCSPGLTVVNIDNGFGAALAAAKTLKNIKREK